MKFGCTTDLLSPLNDDLGSVIHHAAELGVSGLALSLTPRSPFTVNSFSIGNLPFMKEARHHHVKIQSLYGLEILGAEPEAEMDYLKQAVLLSHALGSELVSLKLGFRKGAKPLGVAKEIVEETVDFAEDLDICIGIEPALETDLDSVAATLDFIDSFKHQHIGLVYNTALHRFGDEKLPANAAEIIKSYLLMVIIDQDAAGDFMSAHQALLLLHKAGFEDYVVLSGREGLALDKEKIQKFKDYLNELKREERFISC